MNDLAALDTAKSIVFNTKVVYAETAFSRVWEGVRFSALFSPAGDGRPGEIPCGGRAGFKTGPYSVVEGSRTRPDAFFGKYVDFGVRRVLGAFSRVWEGVRFSALFSPAGDGRPGGIPGGGRAGFKTGPYSVVEGSRTRPDAFFGKYVDFGVRRVLGAFSRVWEGVRFSALFFPPETAVPEKFRAGGRAGFKTGPYSVVEGSRTRPDAFFGKYVDFGVRRVLGAFSRVWEGVRFSALFSPAGDGRPGGIPCGGRAGFKTGPYSVVEGSRTRPDAFLGNMSISGSDAS